MVYSTVSIRSLRYPSCIIWTGIHSARSSLPEDSRQALRKVQLVQVAKTHADFPANILHEISQGERKKVKGLHNTLASAPEWQFRRSGCNGRFQRRAAFQSWRRVLRSRCHLLRLSGGCSSRCLENRLSSRPCKKCLKWRFQNFSFQGSQYFHFKSKFNTAWILECSVWRCLKWCHETGEGVRGGFVKWSLSLW